MFSETGCVPGIDGEEVLAETIVPDAKEYISEFGPRTWFPETLLAHNFSPPFDRISRRSRTTRSSLRSAMEDPPTRTPVVDLEEGVVV